MNLKPCKECPWYPGGKSHPSWPEMVKREKSKGTIKTVVHRCHAKSRETWGTPTKENVCVGSMNFHREKK